MQQLVNLAVSIFVILLMDHIQILNARSCREDPIFHQLLKCCIGHKSDLELYCFQMLGFHL